MDTAATLGEIHVDIYSHWQWEWSRAWGDVGRLHHAHVVDGTHVAAREVARGGWCQCWECRVYVAWSKRHASIPRYRIKRKRASGGGAR